MQRQTKKAVGALHLWAAKHHIPLSTPIYLAVSGGADSLALLAAAAASRFTDITVVTVNHNLQSGSTVQAQRVVEQASIFNLPAVVESVNVVPGGGMEAAARDARYAALDKYPMVLLAHTQNDQMESLLLGLGRGSGSRSLSGMRELRDGKFGRPFLHLTREVMEGVCKENGLVPWSDPHNECRDYLRVKIRKDVTPVVFDVFGTGVLKNFDRTASQLQEDADALDVWADSVTPVNMSDVFLPVFTDDLPVAVQKRILRRWLSDNVSKKDLVRGDVVDRVLGLQVGKVSPLGDFMVRRGVDGWYRDVPVKV